MEKHKEKPLKTKKKTHAGVTAVDKKRCDGLRDGKIRLRNQNEVADHNIKNRETAQRVQKLKADKRRFFFRGRVFGHSISVR
jgi:hypothetical protein